MLPHRLLKSPNRSPTQALISLASLSDSWCEGDLSEDKQDPMKDYLSLLARK